MGAGELLLHLAWKAAFAGMDEYKMFYWVVALHIIGWVMQFIGHGVFESMIIVIKRESQP